MIDKLNELCMWLSHQKGMMSQDYAKELAKIIVQLRQQADRIAELEETIEACYAVQKMQAEEVYKGNDRIAELEKLLEHSVGSDCREMRYIQEIENKDVRIAELEKALDWIATVNAMDYEYQDVAKSLLKERHGIK